MLLLGRTSTSPINDALYQEQPDKFSRRAAYVRQLEDTWWDLWTAQCFDNLVPFPNNAAAKREANIEEGNVCLLRYLGKVTKGDYRLCRVVRTFPDDEGIVRKVEVEMRPKSS